MRIEEMIKCLGNDVWENAEQVRNRWREHGSYPIRYGSEEWKNLNFFEVSVYILNPPDDMLHQFSTKELANLLRDYPYLSMLKDDFENMERFLRFMDRYCAIFRELLRRQDGIEAILLLYRENSIDIAQLNENINVLYRNDKNWDYELFVIWYFKLRQGTMSKSIIEGFTKAYCDKKMTYETINYPSIRRWFILDENRLVLTDGFSPSGTTTTKHFNYHGDQFDAYYYVGTYTKYGVSSPCYMWQSGEYQSATIELMDELDDARIGWTFVEHATTKYNCHSYAWIEKSANNTYWLDSPSVFFGSTLVSYIGKNVQPQPNDILVIYEGTALKHSVVVHPLSSTSPYAYVESKIDSHGVFLTTLYTMMVYYSGTDYYVYRV